MIRGSETRAAKAAKEPGTNRNRELTIARVVERVRSPEQAQSTLIEGPTLGHFFEVSRHPDHFHERWRKFGARLLEDVKGIRWTVAKSDLIPKIAELLDIKIATILIVAWSKDEAIHKILEDSERSSETTIYLELAEHRVEYNSQPFIEIRIRGVYVQKLLLNVELNLKLTNFVLKVQNGVIKEMQSGRCEACGTVTYDLMPVVSKESQAIIFPPSVQLQAFGALKAKTSAEQNRLSLPKPDVATRINSDRESENGGVVEYERFEL